MIAEGIEIDKMLVGEIQAILKKSKYLDQSNNALDNYHDLFSNKLQMIMVIRKGVNYNMFELIKSQSPFSDNDWAQFLGLSTKSMQRYRNDNRTFKSIQSEKIIELAEVTHVGIDIFRDMDKFKLWLNTPNFALGKLKPIELLQDSYGKEMVISELVRIDHGIFV